MGNNTTSKTAEKTASKALPVAALMYLGPNRAFGLPVAYNQLFKVSGVTELPEPLRGQAAKNTDFAACFVPIINLGKALAELKKADSALSVAKSKVMAATQKLAQSK